MKVTKHDIGHSCLVWFDDVGHCEGMILDVNGDDVNLFLFNSVSQRVVKAQIIRIGLPVVPPKWILGK